MRAVLVAGLRISAAACRSSSPPHPIVGQETDPDAGSAGLVDAGSAGEISDAGPVRTLAGRWTASAGSSFISTEVRGRPCLSAVPRGECRLGSLRILLERGPWRRRPIFRRHQLDGRPAPPVVPSET